MFRKLIEQFVVRYATHPRYIDFTHEWIYVKKKQAFVKTLKTKPFASREEMYRFIISDVLKNDPVQFLEFGVYKGESLKFWTSHYPETSSTFTGFDTFEGIPEDWTAGKPKGSYSAGGKLPEIPDPRVSYEVGLFQETVPSFLKKADHGRRKVIHLDADLYTSTLYVLAAFMPYLKPGDLILFDEFGSHLTHEFRAYLDFTSSTYLKTDCLAFTQNQNQAAFILR